MKPIELCTLRGHLNDITCTEPYYIGGRVSLVSADSNGWIIWWDINTRRPNCVWKGHDSNIVTIRQICNGLLLTHSKDSDIKVWDVKNFKCGSREMPAEKYNNVQYFSTDRDGEKDNNILKNELLEAFPLPENVVIPVNALNYCNVDYSNHHLITPATTDSNNFDLYLIFKPSHRTDESLEANLNLKRIAANVDSWKLYKKTITQLNKEQGVEFEIGNENDILKRDKFGIMMKVLFVRDDIFYIGYESGHLIGYHIDFSGATNNDNEGTKLDSVKPDKNVSGLAGLLGNKTKSFDKTIINRDPHIKIIYMNDSCSPNPIISLVYDNKENKIICGSTGKQLTFHKIPEEFSQFNNAKDCERYNLRHSGIQSVSSNNSLLVVGFWDGLIKGYDRDLNEVFKYCKRLPRIDVLESNSGQLQLREQQNSIKLCTVKLIKPNETDVVKSNDYKSLIKDKRDITTTNLLISSYYDGTITIFKV